MFPAAIRSSPDERLEGPVTAALAAKWPLATAKRLPFPFAFACPVGVLREDGRNAGTTEPLSPWGDAVAEGIEERRILR